MPSVEGSAPILAGRYSNRGLALRRERCCSHFWHGSEPSNDGDETPAERQASRRECLCDCSACGLLRVRRRSGKLAGAALHLRSIRKSLTTVPYFPIYRRNSSGNSRAVRPSATVLRSYNFCRISLVPMQIADNCIQTQREQTLGSWSDRVLPLVRLPPHSTVNCQRTRIKTILYSLFN